MMAWIKHQWSKDSAKLFVAGIFSAIGGVMADKIDMTEAIMAVAGLFVVMIQASPRPK